jgi:hypothetical protein
MSQINHIIYFIYVFSVFKQIFFWLNIINANYFLYINNSSGRLSLEPSGRIARRLKNISSDGYY